MGTQSKYIWLMKDKKVISRASAPHVPDIHIPSRWNINKFRRPCPSNFKCFPLYPEAEGGYQKREWIRFLTFLQENMLVGAVEGELFDLYVHPPSKGRELTYAVVYYNVKNRPSISDNQESLLNDPKSPCYSGSTVDEKEIECPHPDPPRKVNDGNLQKNFIKTDPSYLVTLAQGHAGWIFGAMAELVDNSRDANATRLDISIDWLYSKREGKKIPVLSVVDNGCGMYHSDIVRMLSFGHKQPDKDDFDHIGRFGIGFKTGSMKLGRDALILTQTSNSRSVAFLSQSFNKNKDNLEIPIVSYCKKGHYMEVDSSIQPEHEANFHLKAIRDFSPFNEYFIGEKLGIFGENGTGTQIYIWNLDEWGSKFSLEWESENVTADCSQNDDILIRSRRIRSRPGQISHEVPLDYSLKAYMAVLFLEPRMEIYIQRSLVKTQPLVESLKNISIVEDALMDIPIKLTLGRSQVEWERMNCGMFLYWHGRLIEAYKRVGGMIHNADMGRGIVGIVDVTDIMSDDANGRVWVLNNKQGFQDCEAYAKLEDWLGEKFDEYWDAQYDSLQLGTWDSSYKHEDEWVQCHKCHKWRLLANGYDISRLPKEWFCCMPPFNGRCEMPEQKLDDGVITIATMRSGHATQVKVVTKCQTQFSQEENTQQRKNIVEGNKQETKNLFGHDPSMILRKVKTEKSDFVFEDSKPSMDGSQHGSVLKRLRRGTPEKRFQAKV